MKRAGISIILVLVVGIIQAQPNCNALLWKGDSAQYKACVLLTGNQQKFYQFSKEFHSLVDSALLICPYFAYAYREKAAPYVKSGNFIEWKKYIDLAVKYDSLSYLPVRASLRYKFFGDYEGTISDIELLEKISGSDIGNTSNGTYHLAIVKALCYKKVGNIQEGISIIESTLSKQHYAVGSFDYLHLGVMYGQSGDYEKAIVALKKQQASHDFAEVQYYLALYYKKMNNIAAYHTAKQSAINYYAEKRRMFDQYHYMIDQVFEQDIYKL